MVCVCEPDFFAVRMRSTSVKVRVLACECSDGEQVMSCVVDPSWKRQLLLRVARAASYGEVRRAAHRFSLGFLEKD